MAHSRLVSTERNLRKNPIVANEYQKTCEDQWPRMKFEKRPAKLPESRISPSQGENDRVVLATNAQEKEDNSRKLEDEEGDLIQRDFQVGRGTLECLLE
jgi:hypothetical protein